MNIQRVHSGNDVGVKAPHPGRSGGPGSLHDVNGPTQESSLSRETSSLSRSVEVRSLLQHVRATPKVRMDAVQQAGDRLKRGEFGTREAAEKTAAAILFGPQ